MGLGENVTVCLSDMINTVLGSSMWYGRISYLWMVTIFISSVIYARSMGLLPDTLEQTAQDSGIIDVEHLYSLLPASFVVLAFYYNISPVTRLFGALDSMSGLQFIIELALKGVLGGLATYFVYSAGEYSFTVGQQMQSKEKAVQIVLFSAVLVGIVVGIVAPRLIERAKYPVMQIGVVTFLLGLAYVHLLVDHWRLDKEWPHIVAAIVIAAAPYL